MTLPQLINFYHDCYLHDVQAIQVADFFGSKVQYVHVQDKNTLFNKREPYFVDSDWGKQIAKETALYEQEKTLIAGTFFLKGTAKILGKKTSIFCPLFLYELAIHNDEDVFWLEPLDEMPLLNPDFLTYLKTQIPDLELPVEKMLQDIPSNPFSFKGLIQMEDFFKTYFPSLDASGIEHLHNTEYFTKPLKKTRAEVKPNTLTILNGLAVGLLSKPKGSLGILNELKQLAQSKDYSRPIQGILQARTNDISLKVRDIVSSSLLSAQQQKIFHAVHSFDNTLVIGPPGTGKSFSIAALVVDFIRQGQSVLVASKTDQTGQVIADKIEQDFGLQKVVVKTSKKYHINSLKRQMENILAGISTQKIAPTDIEALQADITRLKKLIESDTIKLEKRLQVEKDYGYFFTTYRPTLWNKVKRAVISYRYRQLESVWKLTQTIERNQLLLGEKIKNITQLQYQYRLFKTLTVRRSEVQNLLNALNQEIGSLAQSYFDKIDFNSILKALPVWICNTGTIQQHLPLQKEMFDVVIIDEATQCDIAGALPLLQRAKKMVIVGDPKQLRHLSFLSQNKQELLAEKYGIPSSFLDIGNYRTNSILDLTLKQLGNQDQIIFLNEHFRSKPAIIQFSNQQFYADSLFIMQTLPNDFQQKTIEIIQTNGRRTENGQNLEEAEQIVHKIKSIIEEDAAKYGQNGRSIGVLSPFNAQVSLLKKLLRTLDLKALKRHNILVGTPYHFQGEERDMMFISFVVDAQSPAGAVHYLNKPDVFNVAITRARTMQYIYTSLEIKDLKVHSLLHQYLSSIANFAPPLPIAAHTPTKDTFANPLTTAILEKFDCNIYSAYPLAGHEVDFLVDYKGRTFAIDLVGYPGPFEKPFEIEYRQRLQRTYVEVFTLPYTLWILDKERCIKELFTFIEN